MKAEKARQIIERFPYSSKKRLGKLLFKENPLLFKDEEHARMYIRAVTNSIGKKNRIKQTDKYIGRLPEGEKNDFSPFVLSGKKIGILPDIHIPYHDLEALSLAMKHLRGLNVDTIILDGDVIDCHMLSRWEKDPNKRNIAHEIKLFTFFLDDLRDFFGGIQIVFKLGNHCERLDRFLIQNAPELYDMPVLDYKNLLRMDFTGDDVQVKDRGIEIVGGKRIIKAGKLNIIHGHEFGPTIFDPVNPARGFFLRAKSNVIGGHFHRTSEHIESDMDGKVVGAWSIGCLSDLHPDYRPINKWNLGFAFVAVDGEDFEVHNYKIINGIIR